MSRLPPTNRRVQRAGRLAIVIALLALPGVAARQQQPPLFRAGGDAVRVFVTVTDRDGRLVTDLTRDDFQVRDEGRPQPITLFDNTPQPIRLVVLLDVSGSMEGNLPLLRAAADQLFARLRPDDAVRVGSFGRDVIISPMFSHDPDEMRMALPHTIEPDAPTPLWRAIDDGMRTFGKERDPRRVVLVLSDGKDSGAFGFRDRFVSQAEVIDRAREDDVMVYAVGMRSRQRRSAIPGLGRGGLQAALMADEPDPGLARVAEETGGGYTEIRTGEDLGAAFARIVDELHGQYLLGFEPPKRDGRKHDVEVTVSGKGLKARGDRTYIAPRGD